MPASPQVEGLLHLPWLPLLQAPAQRAAREGMGQDIGLLPGPCSMGDSSQMALGRTAPPTRVSCFPWFWGVRPANPITSSVN